MVRFPVVIAALAAAALLAGCGGSGGARPAAAGGGQSAHVDVAARVCAELQSAGTSVTTAVQPSGTRLPGVTTLQHASDRLAVLASAAYHDPGGDADVGNLLAQASTELGYAWATGRVSYLTLAGNNVLAALKLCQAPGRRS